MSGTVSIDGEVVRGPDSRIEDPLRRVGLPPWTNEFDDENKKEQLR